MKELCEFMLEWFFEVYETGEVAMSPEVYDRAVFCVGVGVPLICFVAVCVSFVFCMSAAFDWARGSKK